jgi:oligoendopeptidase F
MVYEGLSGEPDKELKAIRHSLSHSRKKMTSKKTVETLRHLFGDTKIDLAKQKHAKLFGMKIRQLRKESEKLLTQEIIKSLAQSERFFDRYLMPNP